jgi:hypothetical protein
LKTSTTTTNRTVKDSKQPPAAPSASLSPADKRRVQIDQDQDDSSDTEDQIKIDLDKRSDSLNNNTNTNNTSSSSYQQQQQQEPTFIVTMNGLDESKFNNLNNKRSLFDIDGQDEELIYEGDASYDDFDMANNEQAEQHPIDEYA